MPDREIEEATVAKFIDKNRRTRLLNLLESKKGRLKVRARLAHAVELDSRHAHHISPNQQTIESILKLLTKRGAPSTCYIISENSELDGKSLPLLTALEEIVGSGSASIISCIKGQLGYYEGEEQNERYLLQVR